MCIVVIGIIHVCDDLHHRRRTPHHQLLLAQHDQPLLGVARSRQPRRRSIPHFSPMRFASATVVAPSHPSTAATDSAALGRVRVPEDASHGVAVAAHTHQMEFDGFMLLPQAVKLGASGLVPLLLAHLAPLTRIQPTRILPPNITPKRCSTATARALQWRWLTCSPCPRACDQRVYNTV